MRLFLTITLLLLTLGRADVVTAAPCVTGVWQSDEDTTYTYNLERSKMLDKTRQFLHQVGGHNLFTFTTETLQSFMPDLDVIIEEKPFHLAGFDETHPYRILFQNVDTLALETSAPFSHESVVYVLNFIGPDEFYLYLGEGLKNPRFDFHYREYFKRFTP